jgi:hypothetical protein
MATYVDFAALSSRANRASVVQIVSNIIDNKDYGVEVSIVPTNAQNINAFLQKIKFEKLFDKVDPWDVASFSFDIDAMTESLDGATTKLFLAPWFFVYKSFDELREELGARLKAKVASEKLHSPYVKRMVIGFEM